MSAALSTSAPAPAVKDNYYNHLIFTGEDFRIEFDRRNGLLSKYQVCGVDLLKPGEFLTPNFWRAPTDNDFGGGLQRKLEKWRDPAMRFRKADVREENGVRVVETVYELTDLASTLSLTYEINGDGAMRVTQKLSPAADAEIPSMFRFGMRLRMPKDFGNLDYYGRGPHENYPDRTSSAFIGRWRQSVSEQFYPYVRPQENGLRSDLRSWRVTDHAGQGIEVTADKPFMASALHYTIESLDEGPVKHQTHSPEVEEADLTEVWRSRPQD